jgi:hypothetical protein
MQGPQIATVTQNDGVNVLKERNCGKETWNVTFMTCFQLMKDVIPGEKQKLTKNFSSTTWVLCRNSYIVF